jgi:hypothetical protein
MASEELYDHPGWRWCTYEGAREHVLLEGLRTTFREKLEWLEEAETLMLRFRAGRDRAERESQPRRPAPQDDGP